MDFIRTRIVFKVTMKYLILLFLVSIIRECKSQEENPCVSKETCEKCIQEDPRCAWCSQADYTERKISRCDFVWILEERNCTALENPQNSSVKVDVNDDLSQPGVSEEAAIKIKPQRITVKLRPDFKTTFSMQFRQVSVYPIDVYYLVDFSYPMRNYSNEIKDLGDKIKQKITTNFIQGSATSYFKLGVGSFGDKDDATYLNPEPFRDENRFPGIKNLDFQTPRFLGEVDDLQKALDDFKKPTHIHSPRGTLDALMQVIVCNNTIGWRVGAKKIIVIATGNDFHYAGDGKLSGFVHPNDGKCHLDATELDKPWDYPSLSQINRKIREYNMSLIFAVTDDQLEAYTYLSRRLANTAAKNLTNYSDITDLIKEQYETISSSVEMKDNAAQFLGDVQISYNTKCSGIINHKTNACRGLKPEDTVNFDVTVQFSRCPENHRKGSYEQIFIQPIGRQSTLEVRLKRICDCDCEKTETEVPERNCSGGGTYRCGICNCNENRYGPDCECEGSENQTTSDINGCKRWKGEKICSNRGECRCGKCVCEKPEFYGQYCECDDFSCYQVNNKTCNGHGTCKCGKCVCDSGWSGLDCTCSNTTDNCYKNGIMCSGHGTCECGGCKCDVTYYGQFCEDCPSCPGKCEEFSICPGCILNNIQETIPEKLCEVECEMKNVFLVEKVEVNDTLEERICSVQDEEGCNIFFKYKKQKEDNESTIIHALREKECPSPPDVVAIVTGTIGSIVVAGLLLLIMWKALTYVHDRREFAKFEKERERAKWDSGQNPIFIQPTSTYENPVYHVN